MKVSVYMSPAYNEIIKAYAAYRHRSVSGFLLSTAISEITRHAQKSDLKGLVVAVLKDMGFRGFPSMGEATDGIKFELRHGKDHQRIEIYTWCDGCRKQMICNPLETDLITGYWAIYHLCNSCLNNLDHVSKVYKYKYLREEAWERIGNQIRPRYNRTACFFFNRINEILGWNGQHAEYNHEKILERRGHSIYPDYFDENNKVIIEWLERSHFRNNIEKQKTLNRYLWYKKHFVDFRIFFIIEKQIIKNPIYDILLDDPFTLKKTDITNLLSTYEKINECEIYKEIQMVIN